MIKEIYKYQFPVFKIEAIITVFTIFVALVLANAIWDTTVAQTDFWRWHFCWIACPHQKPHHPWHTRSVFKEIDQGSDCCLFGLRERIPSKNNPNIFLLKSAKHATLGYS